jgi:hypothetical protein
MSDLGLRPVVSDQLDYLDHLDYPIARFEVNIFFR